MTTTQRDIDPNTPQVRPKPFTLAMLDDIEEGQEGLLPVSAQGKPLRVEFDSWINSSPTPENPETVQLFWNDESVETKKWTAPIADADYFIDVPASYLKSGRHEVYYILTLHTSQTERSDVLILTVDLETPELSAIENEPVFETLTIDIEYLILTGDIVEAKIPEYDTAAPGDVVIATWKNPANGNSKELRTDPLTHLNYPYPVRVNFTGDFVREMDDGNREVTYKIQDRAGNISKESAPAKLLIAAIRPERVAPFPWVPEVGDKPESYGALKPEKARNGATVRIPKEAVFYSDDRVEVQFGDPGAPGSICVPVVPPSLDVLIPKQYIAANFKKTLPVYYVIHLPDGSIKNSAELTLAIAEYPTSSFAPPQLSPPHSDPVYKKNILATGLPVQQRQWPFISEECLITITVTGTGIDGTRKTDVILDKHQVTVPETSNGVLATISQGFMLELKDNVRFIVRTEVSFDGGAIWFPFSELRPMLQA